MARTGKKRICGRRSCSCSWRNMKWRGAHRRLSGCPNRNRRTINAQNERASYICMAGYLLLLFALKYLELAIIHASDSHFMDHLLRSRPPSWVLIIIISLVFPVPSGPPNGSPVASSFANLLVHSFCWLPGCGQAEIYWNKALRRPTLISRVQSVCPVLVLSCH